MKYCPQCQREFDDVQLRFCLNDGALLSLPDPYQLVGHVLAEKYRIDALVGVGGMGAVYAAHHCSLNRRVAFKIFLPHLALKDRQMLDLFEREAQTAALLSHRNIVTIFDSGQATATIAYIAMEWLDGRTLDEELAQHGPLSLERTGEILQQVAAALAEAHDNRVIHRDLKPTNVMIAKERSGREVVKVLDFGIGKVLSATEGTRVSRIAGTPHYASPEQFQRGAQIDGRVDIYALGVMLFEMLTGRLPFEGNDYEELMQKHRYDAPPALRSLRPDLPIGIEALVNRMLAKNPAQRPARVGEVPQLFEQACQAVSASPSAPTVIDPEPINQAPAADQTEPDAPMFLQQQVIAQTTVPRMLVAAVVVLLLIVAGGYLVLKEQSGWA